MEKHAKKISILGAGYVGSSLASVIALNNPDYTVVVQDINEKLIAEYQSKQYNIKEEKLGDFLDKTIDKNLFFTTSEELTHKDAEIYFICVSTDSKRTGTGQGENLNISAIRNCLLEICRNKKQHNDKKGFVIVEKSTVPVGTAKYIRNLLEVELSTNHQELLDKISVISSPEFSAEGTFIKNLVTPDRVIIGREMAENPVHKHAEAKIEQIYRSFVAEGTTILKTNTFSSELTKLASNAFLAQRISSINSISAICDKTGADIEDVTRGVGLDSRISKKYLSSGLGFGGYCLEKDLKCLVYLASSLGLREVAEYWKGVITINEFQSRRMVDSVVRHWFHGSVQSGIFLVVGCAFKKDTGDLRNSRMMTVLNDLIEEGGARISLWDPWVEKGEVEWEFRRIFGEQLESKSKRMKSKVTILLDSFNDVLQIRKSEQADFEAKIKEYLIMDAKKQKESNLHESLQNLKKLIEESQCILFTIDHTIMKVLEPCFVEWMNAKQKVFDGRNFLDQSRFIRKGIDIKNFGKGFSSSFACHYE